MRSAISAASQLPGRGLADFLFGLRFYSQFNSYDHIETVSSPNHTFFLRKLD